MPDNYLVVANAAARDSRIPHPTPGQSVMLIDTGDVLYWYGPSIGWRQAWNTQWGMVGYAEITANSATLPTSGPKTSPTAGLVIPYTPLVNRQYRFEFDGLVSSSVNGDEIVVNANADQPINTTTGLSASPTYGAQVFTVQQSGVAGDSARFSWEFTVLHSLPTLFYVCATQINGTGACVLVGNANGVTAIRIIDLGKTGPPQYR